MTFVSLPFFLFVAGTALLYYIVPKKYQWLVLLLASYVFYWINSHWLLLVMLATTMVTFLIGRAIGAVNARSKAYLKENPGLTREEKRAHKDAAKKKAKRILRLGILVDLCILLFLKYYNFFGENLNHLVTAVGGGEPIPGLRLLLPLGISFYTLQAIAYMVDISRGKYEADRHLGKFMLFMSFFPQIVQGPIARHNQLAHQLYAEHEFDYNRLLRGVQLMLWGLFKKIVIADRVAIPVDQIFNNHTQYHGLMIFLGAALYGLQVYADFSGGMDIARGVSQILGIELELNFRQPYFSKSIEEFWRRWHITLGSFMRDYVFYPLSLSKSFANLSRKTRSVLGQFVGKRLPSFLAMFIVYFLIGFWHGSSWKYIAYGVWNGVFIVAGILLDEFYTKARTLAGIREEAVTWRIFQMIRTFILVAIGRIFSRAYRLRTALGMLRRMSQKWWSLAFLTDGSLPQLGLNTANWLVLAAGVMVLFMVDFFHERGVSLRGAIARQPLIFRWTIYIGAILFLLVFGIYGPGYDAASFIYEQF